MKYSNLCSLSLVLLLFVFIYWRYREGFAGAQVQLLTSRPYYGWYDYFQRTRGPTWDWNYGWWRPFWSWRRHPRWRRWGYWW